MSELTDEMRKYYERKRRCPRCYSKNLVDTQINLLDFPPGTKYVDKRNKTRCAECDWSGVIDDLRG